MSNLANLQELDLSSNQLSGTIPSQVGNLTSLTGLWMNDNHLSGSVPPELGQLGKLLALDLSENQLSGSIPPQFGNLASLQGLALSSNQLSGSIPPELGQLASLLGLYLNDNELRGLLPQSLPNLHALDIFYFDTALLCLPDSAVFAAWLAGISTKSTGFADADARTAAKGEVGEELWYHVRVVYLIYPRLAIESHELGMSTLFPDTSPEAEQVLIELLRQAPVARKLEMLGQINAAARQLAVQGLRARHPRATEVQLRRYLADLLLGPELAARAYGPRPADPDSEHVSYVASAEDTSLAKLEWYRLDPSYLRQWAAEFGASDLLERALGEIGAR